MRFRNLNKQYETLKPQMDVAIKDAISGGRYIGGSQVGELELQLADQVGSRHCITCANGTDALTLALMAWGIGKGDAVFVPDFTFFATAEAAAFLGATPVFVDVDESTFNLDAEKLEEAIVFIKAKTELTPRVVIAVDLFGLPADYLAIREICTRHELYLLEDGAQGFGGSIGDERACSFGDISTTSFFPAKPLGCYGDGGAIFTDNDEWADLLRSYAVHGKGSMKYDNVRIGMNSRLDTIQAAILKVKLEVFVSTEFESVNKAANWYTEELSNTSLVLPSVPKGYASSWAQYTVQLPNDVNRAELQARLKAQDIPTMVYYPKPMHTQLAFKDAHFCFDEGKATVELCNSVLSLPIGPYITKKSVKSVASAIRGLLSDKFCIY